jgi:plastocyanin
MKSCIITVIFIVFGMPLSLHALPSDTLTVRVLGTAEDARFEPMVIRSQPGDVIRFEVVEGLHTVTAYHPKNRRPQRIPKNAETFDSGVLTAGDVWFLNPEVEGVYDYFCLPHERMGHAGRILVGKIKQLPHYPTGRMDPSMIDKLDFATKVLLND